jgi:hypothetical protein
MDHEKRDCRKARDGKKNTDLSPFHLPTLREIRGPLLATNRRKTSRPCCNPAPIRNLASSSGTTAPAASPRRGNESIAAPCANPNIGVVTLAPPFKVFRRPGHSPSTRLSRLAHETRQLFRSKTVHYAFRIVENFVFKDLHRGSRNVPRVHGYACAPLVLTVR